MLLRTLGFGVFSNEVAESVVNETEAEKKRFLLRNVFTKGKEEKKEHAPFYVEIINKQRKKSLAERNLPTKNIYARVVGDNVSYSRVAFHIIEEKYPKLFFIECTSYTYDLMIENFLRFIKSKNLQHQFIVVRNLFGDKRLSIEFSNLRSESIDVK